MSFVRVTEQTSHYRHLEKMTVAEILTNINKEDQTVPQAVAKVIPQIEKLVAAIADKMLAGGRLFYMGAGTSGRLGIVDAWNPAHFWLTAWFGHRHYCRWGCRHPQGQWNLQKMTGSRAGKT